MLLNCFLAPEDMQVGQGLLKHEIPWFLGLVFDTGLSVTPLWSDPVYWGASMDPNSFGVRISGAKTISTNVTVLNIF